MEMHVILHVHNGECMFQTYATTITCTYTFSVDDSCVKDLMMFVFTSLSVILTYMSTTRYIERSGEFGGYKRCSPRLLFSQSRTAQQSLNDLQYIITLPIELILFCKSDIVLY